MSTNTTLPLFPLNTVLFPGGPLPLRIFEPRYMDMIGDCMRQDTGFGVCLIRNGQEVGQAADIYTVGTLAKVIDFEVAQEGMLGILVQGQQRFQVQRSWVKPNQLLMGDISWLEDEVPCPIPDTCHALADMLQAFIRKVGDPYTQLPTDYTDASWVSQRLTELLPISLLERQRLLESNDPLERLRHIQATLQRLEFAHI